MAFGLWQIIIIVVVLVLFFGRNRVSDIMKDLGKGIKAFKDEVDPVSEKEPQQTSSKNVQSSLGHDHGNEPHLDNNSASVAKAAQPKKKPAAKTISTHKAGAAKAKPAETKVAAPKKDVKKAASQKPTAKTKAPTKTAATKPKPSAAAPKKPTSVKTTRKTGAGDKAAPK